MLEIAQITVPETTTEQYYFAVIALSSILIGILYVIFTSGYSGLSREQRRVKSSFVGMMHSETPNSIRIRFNKDPRNYAIQIRQLFEREEPEEESAMDSLKEIYGEVSKVYDPVVRYVPRSARWAYQSAISVLVFGTIALSTGYVVRLIEQETVYPSIQTILTEVVDSSILMINTGIDTVALFPFAPLIANLLFAYSVQFLQFTYEHPVGTSIVLIVGGSLVILFEHSRIEEPDESLVRETVFGYKAIGAVLLTWLAGVTPTVLVGKMGFPTLGAGIGLFTSFVFFVYFTYRLSLRIKEVWDQFPTYGYTARITRIGVSIAAVVGWTIAIAYVIVIASEGKFGEIILAVYRAPVEKQILIASVPVLPVLGVVWKMRRIWPDVKASVIETVARGRIKTRAMKDGIPYAGVIFGYTLGWSFTESIILGIIVGVVFGIGLRAAYVGLNRARHGTPVVETGSMKAKDVLVQGYVFDDPTGEEQYVTVINGDEKLAHPDREEVVQDTIDAISDLRENGEIVPTVTSWHANNLEEYGISDINETVEKIEERTRKIVFSELRERDGSVKRSTLIEELDDIPEHIAEPRVRDWVTKGIIRTDGDYFILHKDPWRSAISR